MKRPLTHVSDHAVIRYLERVHGWDIDALRQEIGRKVDQAARAGAIGVVIEGMRYTIGQNATGPVVMTVAPAEWHLRNRRAGRPGGDGGGRA